MLKSAMDVLSLFSPQRPELGVTDAASLLGKPKSTTSRWLTAMEQAGFLERSPVTGRYRISLRLAAIGEMARHASPLQRLALPLLEHLVAQTQETANLAVLSAGEVINIEGVESPRPIMTLGWVGRRLPMHATAAGKIFLAWRPRDEMEELARPPLERFTEHTITDLDSLHAELAKVRDSGYAVVRGELEEDLAAIATPVWNHSGGVIAAISLGGPSSRLTEERLTALVPPLAEASRDLSRKLGARADAGVVVGSIDGRGAGAKTGTGR